MGRQEVKSKFLYSLSLRGKCLQVWEAIYNKFEDWSYFSHLTQIYSSLVVAEGMDVDTSPVEVNADSQFMSLSVNSVVELALGSGNSYGIIRWIGTLPGRQETMAGLELVIFILTCYCTYSNVTKTSMDNYGNTVWTTAIDFEAIKQLHHLTWNKIS